MQSYLGVVVDHAGPGSDEVEMCMENLIATLTYS